MTKAFNDCTSLDDFEVLFPPRTLPQGAEVVRAAPSPTGMPHIGTAMQATLDRALADRIVGGIFILRVEDTDRARTVPGAVEAIIDGLKWIDCIPNEGTGFGGDYGPYTQSERQHIYHAAADYLLKQGHAYRCFCSEDRLELLRKRQAANHQTPMYDRHCRNLDPLEADKRVMAGEKHVVRMKIPDNEKISFMDLVRGEITFDSSTVDDQVLMKSDGMPTYHLAVVVDDHFMRVTTVVRGEEWIPSTPKHVLLYRYFGWQAPRFLHTVLLRDAAKRKLSKRSGDTTLSWFMRQGILPIALRNFLTRIMWAHPDGKDVYPYQEFIDLMKTEALPSTGPVADMVLLQHINSKYIIAMSAEDRAAKLVEYLDYLINTNQTCSDTIDPDAEHVVEMERDTLLKLRHEAGSNMAYNTAIMEIEPGRHQRLADMVFGSTYFYDSTFMTATAADFAKHATPEQTAAILSAFAAALTSSDLLATIKQIAVDNGLKDKQVFMTIRLALSGRERTPPIPDIVSAMGIERIRARLSAALNLSVAA